MAIQTRQITSLPGSLTDIPTAESSVQQMAYFKTTQILRNNAVCFFCLNLFYACTATLTFSVVYYLTCVVEPWSNDHTIRRVVGSHRS